jgi:hypothetical protein
VLKARIPLGIAAHWLKANMSVNDFKPGVAVITFLIVPLVLIVWAVLAALHPPLLMATLFLVFNAGAAGMMWVTWRAVRSGVAYIRTYRYTRADNPWSYWYAVSIAVFGSGMSLLLAVLIDSALWSSWWQ